MIWSCSQCYSVFPFMFGVVVLEEYNSRRVQLKNTREELQGLRKTGSETVLLKWPGKTNEVKLSNKYRGAAFDREKLDCPRAATVLYVLHPS